MTLRPALPEIALIGLLCLVAYAPSLSIPLLDDDYPNLAYAQINGSPARISELSHDPIFRPRATSCWLMFGLWKAFGLAPVVFRSASLALHFANCCLVYAIVRLRWPFPRSPAFWTAAFFAVHEGHQEAIMWFSACNELLLFFFGAASLLCWLWAGQQDVPSWRRGAMEAVSIVAFGLALVSKESAVIWLPLFLLAGFSLPKPAGRLNPAPLIRLLPHAALAALALGALWSTRTYSFRFSDGSFSLAAPFWITWARSFARLLWVWGWLALAAVCWFANPLRGSIPWRRWCGLGSASCLIVFSPIRRKFPAARPTLPAPGWPSCSHSV
jgi:hypothetical protein